MKRGKLRYLKIATLVILLFFITGCAGVVVKGVVRDKNTGSPIPGASVSICGRSTTSTKEGTYKIEPKCKGDIFRAVISAPGYYLWSGTVSKDKKKVIVKDVELEPLKR